MTRADAVDLGYLIAAVCFILALRGLSAPRTARTGNLIGVAGMVLAVLVTFALPGMRLVNLPLILLAGAIGAGVGVPAARRTAMTAVPQLVAAFNGVGGGAAALVSVAEFARESHTASWGVTLAVVFSTLVGAVSFSGSALTFAKLQELMTTRPVVLRGGQALIYGALAAVLVVAGLVLADRSVLALAALVLASLGFGVLVVLPVGGADVPIVISLLNAFTGLAVAASGAVLSNTLLVVAGTLVGASGALLTSKMSSAMGRSTAAILFGAFSAKPVTAGEDGGAERTVRSGTAEDVAVLLAYSSTVSIVPGYGLAVAQAQHTVRELADLLEARGVEVSYAIHPVAGRMPGHMNVLLAEANVPYEQLREMETANPEFPRTDVVVVVGANDVVNPSARSSPGSPIYGMPILDVDTARHVVFLKRSMRPGFAGIDNPLLYDERTTMLFGDAKDTLRALVAAVKNA